MAIDFAPSFEFRARTQQFESRSFHFRGPSTECWWPPPTAPVRCLCVSVSERRLRRFFPRKAPSQQPVAHVGGTRSTAIQIQIQPPELHPCLPFPGGDDALEEVPVRRNPTQKPRQWPFTCQGVAVGSAINLITWLKSELHANASIMSSVSA